MLKRTAVFVDLSNLYYCTHKKWPDRKINYKAYLDLCGENIYRAIAYGAHIDHQADGFIKCLKSFGFETKFKAPKEYQTDAGIRRKADFDCDIVVDMIRLINKVDVIVLGCADGDLLPGVEYVREHGIDVRILACGISRDLKDGASSWTEISESILENPS